jgi:voltage-dependent anion channel protein 2
LIHFYKRIKMGPPKFGDLGKQASDVFGKGYHFGLLKLEVKTKTDTGVEFTSGGSSNIESGKVAGNLETKYKVKDLGLTLTEKWSTDNTLNTTLDVAEKLLPGLKVTLDTSFAPSTGAKSGKLKTEYKHEAATFTADMDLGLSAINATAVVGHKGWLAGYQTCFDLGKSAITKNNFGIGYSASDFVLHTSVVNGTDFGGSVYQKVSPKLETGVNLGWSSANSSTSFGIGAKYVLEDGAAIRAKINNKSEIGLGYQQKLRDGVTVTLSTLVNSANINAGGHKVGVSLEMEA